MTGFLLVGPRAMEIKALITVPLRFLFIIIVAIGFGNLNSSVDGQG